LTALKNQKLEKNPAFKITSDDLYTMSYVQPEFFLDKDLVEIPLKALKICIIE